MSFSGEQTLHNGGGGGGWGKGNQTGNGFAGGEPVNYEDDSLFAAFPPFFIPIDHIDISLYINDTFIDGLTGLNSSTKKDVLPVIKPGDNVYGTALITLQDGSVRNAIFQKTTLGIDTKLALYAEYKYKIVSDNEEVYEDIFTTTAGIDIPSEYLQGSFYGFDDSTVNAFSDGKDTYTVSGNRIVSPAPGDKILTPVFKCEPEVSFSGTGVTAVPGAEDSYVFDYVENQDGVSMDVQAPSLTGTTAVCTIDGTSFTLNSGDNAYNMILEPGEHILVMNISGSGNCAAQTFTKTITVYVKPDYKIKDADSWNESTGKIKYRYLKHGATMPFVMTSEAAAAFPSAITNMDVKVDGNSCSYSGGSSTGSPVAKDTTHSLYFNFEGPYCIFDSVSTNISIAMKPIRVQVAKVVFRMNVTVDGDFGLRGYLHLGKNSGNWQTIGDFGGTGLGMSGGDNDITGSCNLVYVTLDSLNENISYETDTADYDQYSGNDQLGYGSTSVSLQDAVNGRNSSDQYSIPLHTSGADGSSDSTLTVKLIDNY
ncbi:MAG: hypothetical protein J5798_03050 [Spirochaetaceae bacterium]|nr:hypothetical protein [Spirochaetaceae bacterium]